MVGVGFGELFYSRVVDTKDKGGLACLVSPQACGVWRRLVSVGSKSSNDFVESKETRFFQSVHAFADIEVDETIGGNVDVVFIPYLFQYFRGVESHVLVVGHVGAEVEVVNFDA